MSIIMHESCPKTAQHQNDLPRCHKSIWITKALVDAAILRSILCITALYIDLASGQGFTSAQYLLKRDAIRTISDRVSNAEAAVSDGTIAAVAYLAIQEVSYLHYRIQFI